MGRTEAGVAVKDFGQTGCNLKTKLSPKGTNKNNNAISECCYTVCTHHAIKNNNTPGMTTKNLLTFK